MANTINVRSLEQFKKDAKAAKLNIFTSRSTGKKYATNPKGELVAWAASDCDFTKPMVVLTMSYEDRQWEFIVNGEMDANYKPRVAEATI